jgi:hypothetical protein
MPIVVHSKPNLNNGNRNCNMEKREQEPEFLMHTQIQNSTKATIHFSIQHKSEEVKILSLQKQ